MLFTSYGFIGFIIVLAVVYYLVPKKIQAPVLLCASLIYYAMADIRYLIFIGVTVVSIWFAALKIEINNKATREYVKLNKETMSSDEKKAYKKSRQKVSFVYFLAPLLLNLLILAVVKYTDFFLQNMAGLAGRTDIKPMDFIVPLGISFYTFQSVGYLIDVYRESIDAEHSLLRYALFVTFFPQLIQGPIGRFSDLSETLYSPHYFDSDTVGRGVLRILWGYFKKLVIADRLLIGVSTMISDTETYRGGYVLIMMLLYTLELYADFTGGIDITIGIAKVLGITMKENFIRPYLSTSLADYWRRWHISMCSWFRDYVFYPVSTSKMSIKLSKWARKHLGDSAGGKLPVYLSSFVVWLCTGIWHGAGTNFIVWGLLNFAILTLSEEFSPLCEKFHKKFGFSNTGGYKVFMILRTFVLICILNLFDCFATAKETLGLLASIFRPGSLRAVSMSVLADTGLKISDCVVAGVAIIVVFGVSIYEEKTGKSVTDVIRSKPYVLRYVTCLLLLLVTLLFGVYGIGYDSSQFIYNRF